MLHTEKKHLSCHDLDIQQSSIEQTTSYSQLLYLSLHADLEFYMNICIIYLDVFQLLYMCY